MENLLLINIGILLLIIFMLVAKVYSLRKSAQEIAEVLRDRLTSDTNTLIDISTRDPYMRKLAADINVQLRLLRKERHRYRQGDLSVVMDKNGCVTFSNTAHNLNAVTVGRLFDRFYTVEASRNSTGLGLSIAKLLIERMGGSISAHYQSERLYVQLIFRDQTK